MKSTFNCVICAALLALTGAFLLPRNARADGEPTAMGGGPVLVLAAGALALNAGATIANGAALAAGKPDRGHGMFGVVLGGATVAAGAVGLAVAAADDDVNSERFSIVLAGCGLASLLTGYLNVRGADKPAEGSSSGAGEAGHVPRLSIVPIRGRDCGWAAAVQVEF